MHRGVLEDLSIRVQANYQKTIRRRSAMIQNLLKWKFKHFIALKQLTFPEIHCLKSLSWSSLPPQLNTLRIDGFVTARDRQAVYHMNYTSVLAWKIRVLVRTKSTHLPQLEKLLSIYQSWGGRNISTHREQCQLHELSDQLKEVGESFTWGVAELGR